MELKYDNQNDCECSGGQWTEYDELLCEDDDLIWYSFTEGECGDNFGIWDYEEIYPISCNGICSPSTLWDIDGDNRNDNPWKKLYPWNDGDYIIVTPKKWFADGDAWTADLSELGQTETLTQAELDNIVVIPNPYVVSSIYNEEVYGQRLIFDRLPQQCTIKIYTITGEFVNQIDHGSNTNLDGTNHWDLTNKDGGIVNPGLYIYTVEAGSLEPKIGKFVIIR